jgi:anti-sigma28 factor (negative regulator of flagellin synthesis)
MAVKSVVPKQVKKIRSTRTKKLKALKNKIKSGAYKVDAAALAKALFMSR